MNREIEREAVIKRDNIDICMYKERKRKVNGNKEADILQI